MKVAASITPSCSLDHIRLQEGLPTSTGIPSGATEAVVMDNWMEAGAQGYVPEAGAETLALVEACGQGEQQACCRPTRLAAAARDSLLLHWPASTLPLESEVAG